MRFRLIFLSILAVCVATLSGCDLFVSADGRVARAQTMIAAHDYRAAMIELKSALQADSEHIEARILLAEVSLLMGDADAADKELRRAIAAGATQERTAVLMADTRLGLGKAQELLGMLDRGALVLHEPQRSTYRGRALLDLRQPEPALAAFKAALEASPQDRKARIGLAEAYAALGRSEEALHELDEIIAAEPKAADALLARGTLQVRRGEFEAAEKSLTAAQEHGVGSLTIRQQAAAAAALAETQLARNDIKAARDSLAKLTTVAPDAPITRVVSARIAMAEQNYAQAATDLQKVVTSAPDFVPARFLLGAVLFAQGNLGQAELQLSEALQRAPANLEARKLLAQVRLRLQRPDAAMEALTSSDARQANLQEDSQLDALLGLAHLQKGDETKGLELLKRGVADNPGNRGLKLELATAYLRSGANAEAMQLMRNLEHLPGDVRRERLLIAAVAAAQGAAAASAEVQSLVSQYSNEPEILNLAGAYDLLSSRHPEALARFRLAVQKAPQEPVYLLNMARAQVALGNPTVAREALEKALELRNNWVPASSNLALLDVSEGKIDQALARVAKLKAAAPRDPAVSILEGDIRMAQKNYAAAATAFDAASALQPNAQAALKSYRARTAGKLDKPAAPLETWIKQRPTDTTVRLVLADAYRLAGDRKAAIEQYEAVTRQDKPDPNVGALNNLAWLYYETGDRRAEAVAKQAFTAAPNIPEVADTYGWVLLQAGRPAEALPVLKDAAARAQNQPDIAYHYAAALAATGSVEQARSLLQTTLERSAVFTTRAEAQRLLEQLQTR